MKTGIFPLPNADGNDFALTTAGTYTGQWVTGFKGIKGLSASLRFAYGSGGTTAKAYLQTSLDQGNTAIDIGCFAFALLSKVFARNYSAETPETVDITPTDGTMGDAGAIDGLLGDRFRLKIVVVGTYAGSTVLAARIHAR